MADASFTVGEKCFQVHSLIINANSSILASNINGSIGAVNPDVFQLLLEYIYAGRIPSSKKVTKHGKGLIDLANRYEIAGFKMTIENILVKERIMDKKNVVDYILFADAQCCPLLKEYAICFFLMHHKEILKSEHSKCLRDSGELMTEIMLLMNHTDDDDSDSECMTVNDLRQELGERKLDVEGSRDALVARLERAKRQKTE